MRIELLATGDELLSGAVTDTNSTELMRRLAPLGLQVARVTLVRDDPDDLMAALREITARADVLVCGGGLGPTSDDHTLRCVQRLLGDPPLIEDGPTRARIETGWVARGRSLPLPEPVVRQALVPQGVQVLPNQVGTAPGLTARLDGCEAYFFAGVPREFFHLVDTQLVPRLTERTGGVLPSRTLRCLHLPESTLDALVAPIGRKYGLRVGLRAAAPETWATFRGVPGTSDHTIQAAVDEAMSVLGDKCFSVRGLSLEAEVVTLLQGLDGVGPPSTVAVAESCTGGMIASRLTDIPGVSSVFRGGVVAYDNAVKEGVLGVAPSTLTAHGAVSAEVAAAMAEGVAATLGSDWGVGITGIAGPGGGSENKPVGLVFGAVRGPGGVVVEQWQWKARSRDEVRAAAASAALDLLRRQILVHRNRHPSDH